MHISESQHGWAALTIVQNPQGNMVRAAAPELKNGVGVELGVKREVEPKMLELPDPKRFPGHKRASELCIFACDA